MNRFLPHGYEEMDMAVGFLVLLVLSFLVMVAISVGVINMLLTVVAMAGGALLIFAGSIWLGYLARKLYKRASSMIRLERLNR